MIAKYIFLFFLSCAFCAFELHAASITGLGYLPGGGSLSFAESVSGDGKTIVGTSDSTAGNQAFIYKDNQMTAIGDLPGGSFYSRARRVSADGSAVVGESSSSNGVEAFLYRNNQLQGLGHLSSAHSQSFARGVSNNGDVVVGDSGGGSFIYENGQMISLSSVVPDATFPDLRDVSADGSIAAGSSRSMSQGGLNQAFVLENGQLDRLGFLPGATIESSNTVAISSDGQILIGTSFVALEPYSFVYSGGVMMALPHLDEDNESYATGLSMNGARIVGGDGLAPTPNPCHQNFTAIVWQKEAQGGYQVFTLHETLLGMGLDVSEAGWTSLNAAFDISDDGRYVVGCGVRNGDGEAFVVELDAQQEFFVPLNPITYFGIFVALTYIFYRQKGFYN